MRTGLVVIALLAACGGQGVDLEVTSDVPFDRVELFLANDICYDGNNGQCDQGVAWQTGMTRPPGAVFVMKGDEDVVVAEQRGNTAVLHLEATDSFREPKLMAIVGFKDDRAVAYATLSGERIPANSAQRWKVALEPADMASEDITTGPSGAERDRRVFAWKRQHVADPSKLSRCLAMQGWDGSRGEWKSLFIVPDSDPDCDGEDVECDPLYANFNDGAPPALCVTPAPDIQSMPCTIGTSLCADGKSDDATCSLTMDKKTCVPHVVCDDCADQPALASCLAMSVRANTPQVFECVFMPGDQNASCGILKPGSYNHLVLPMPCDQVEARPLAMPLASASSPGRANINTVEIAVNIIPNGSVGACTIELQWDDGLATAGDTAYYVLMVRSPLSGNQIAVPVKLTIGDGPVNCVDTQPETPMCMDQGMLLQDPMYDCH